MAQVLAAATKLFNFFFHVSTGSGDTIAAGVVPTVIDLITSNDFLLIGLALMLTGAAVSYLSKLIRG